jgi:4-hydroxy-2-oxoheptanedioate aldolase
MRPSKTLAKTHNKRCARVVALGHYLPFYIRYAAHHGFDAIWLDLEHRAMEQREVQSLIALCHQFDIDCLVRPPTQERTRLYRYFEDGAAGLLMPLVADADEAARIVEAVKFPPMGNRGLDGAGLDADFAIGAEDFPAAANRETFITIQIETEEALGNAAAIAAVDGVDGLFVGPGDLGLRLGLSGGMTVAEATQQVADAAAQHGKFWGIAGGGPAEWKTYRQQGAQMLIGAGDFALTGVLEAAKANMDGALGE